MQKRPKSLTCYICGREFGTTSLGIHLPQCQKKFINNEQLKPPSQRRKLPQEPPNLQQTLMKAQKGQIDDRDIEEFKNQNLQHYYENVLVPCQNCGRTFQEDRLVVHLRSCKPKSNNIQQSKQQQPKHSQYPQQKEFQKPKTLVCYICGREYGTTSLKIHIPQCQKKFINNEQLKPKNQRKPLPEPPAELMRLMNADNISRNELDDYNKTASEKYNNDVLQECPNCGRTFLEDRLQVHLRSCKGDNPAKKRSINNYDEQKRQVNNVTFKNNQVNEQTFGRQNQQFQMNDDGANMNLVSCNICGRSFNSDRINQHQKICQKAQQNDKKRQKIMDLKNKKKQMQMKSVIQNEKKYESKMKSDIKAKPKWKQQHEDFVNTMKYMRQVKAAQQRGVDIRDIEPPPQQQDYNQDYVGCPHCGRKFNQQVAERHIPKCKNIINKPKAPPKKNQQMKPPPSQNQKLGLTQQKPAISQNQQSSQKSHRQTEVNVSHQNTNFAMKQQVRMEQSNQQSIRNQNGLGVGQQRMSQAASQQQRPSQVNQQMNSRQRATPTQQNNQQNNYQRQSSNNQRQVANSYQRMHSNNAKAREQQSQGVFGQQKGYKFKY